MGKKYSSVQDFLTKKGIEISFKRYGIDVLGSMAMGLFASLLIGTILNTIGLKLGIPFFSETIWPIAKEMTGPAIAVAIAMALKAPNMVVFSSLIVGYAGNQLGGPAGAWIASWFSVELGKVVSKETKVDIIVTPAVTIISGVSIGTLLGPVINNLMSGLGKTIMLATSLQPFWMGIVISVIVGIVLTLPISSAALCMMLSLAGLAGGAATAGCSAQMIGFAVMSFKENGWSGLLAQGLGTSMLQIPNILKNWKIWIPPTLASAITGPIATTIFKMENIPLGSGMGTSGLVGQIGTITAMGEAGASAFTIYTGIVVVHFLLPALLSLIFYRILKKIGWIKEGDLKLNL